jgi:hypothetical protein
MPLLDEIKRLKGAQECFAGFLAVLKGGYKRRCEETCMEKHSRNFVAAKYPTYSLRCSPVHLSFSTSYDYIIKIYNNVN